MIDTDALIEELAAELGVSGATVRKWRSRRMVPHHIRHRLAEAAADRNCILRTSHFDGFGSDKSAAAA